MATSAHISKVRALYKRILVLHRFLPIDLKALGDQYVKDEFRRHKNAASGEVKSFMKEWEVKPALFSSPVTNYAFMILAAALKQAEDVKPITPVSKAQTNKCLNVDYGSGNNLMWEIMTIIRLILKRKQRFQI